MTEPLDKTKLAHLIVANVPTRKIADVFGVDESYISQLRHDEQVTHLVEEVRATQKKETLSKQDQEFDEKLELVELSALNRLENLSQFANLGQALAIFKATNGARRRKDGTAAPQINNTAVHVSLIVSEAQLPKFVKSKSNEIIEVDGKTLVTATPARIDAILYANNAKNAEAVGIAQVESHLNRTADRLENVTAQIQTPVRRRVPVVLTASDL